MLINFIKMPIYKCELCYKEFNQKCNYTRHTQNIRKCNQTLEKRNNKNIQCVYCKKYFTRKDTLDVHLISACKVRESSETTKLLRKIENLEKEVNKLKDSRKNTKFIQKEPENTDKILNSSSLKKSSVKNKKCIELNCNNRAYYNLKNQKKPLYCSNHKLDGMVNVSHKICNSEWCLTSVNNKKYDGYCLFCFINLFPDKPVSRNYKTKEYVVVDFIKTTFPNLDWIFDRVINNGCSKRRPDILLDLGYQVLIIEVDENQHTDYDCICENKRIMELSQDLGHRPLIFIRFNPDNYTLNGENVTSCWSVNRQGICVIKTNKVDEWNERLIALKKSVEYWIHPSNITNKTVEIIHLFYDM